MANAKTAEEHGHGSDHSHDEKGADHAHPEKSGAPHGGTPVKVGDHGFHLELVPDVADVDAVCDDIPDDLGGLDAAHDPGLDAGFGETEFGVDVPTTE